MFAGCGGLASGSWEVDITYLRLLRDLVLCCILKHL